jgi:integrase
MSPDTMVYPRANTVPTGVGIRRLAAWSAWAKFREMHDFVRPDGVKRRRSGRKGRRGRTCLPWRLGCDGSAKRSNAPGRDQFGRPLIVDLRGHVRVRGPRGLPPDAPADRPGLTPSVEAVVSSLGSAGQIVGSTLNNRTARMRWFAAFLEAQGVQDLDEVTPAQVVDFVDSRRGSGARATLSERHSRRAAVRMLYKEAGRLGLAKTNPALDLDLPPRQPIRTRPLLDSEIEIGRSYALRSVKDLRRSVAWALSEATGRTCEIGHVRVADVDVPGSRVWLSGSSAIDARWGHLTPWGMAQVIRRLEVAEVADESLIVWRSEPRTLRASCSQAVTETLRAAGLHGPHVRPRSIVAWAGRRALDGGVPIERVTLLLGMRSMDEAADFLCFDWRRRG